jgi:hypothetical protein
VANVAKYLTHLAQYAVAELDGFADVSVSDVSTVNCFAYFGEASRRAGGATGREFEQDVGWFVILPNSLHSINVGDRLDYIVDSQGVSVRDEGRIEERVVYRHHRKGVQFVQVRLNDY